MKFQTQDGVELTRGMTVWFSHYYRPCEYLGIYSGQVLCRRPDDELINVHSNFNGILDVGVVGGCFAKRENVVAAQRENAMRTLASCRQGVLVAEAELALTMKDEL